MGSTVLEVERSARWVRRCDRAFHEISPRESGFAALTTSEVVSEQALAAEGVRSPISGANAKFTIPRNYILSPPLEHRVHVVLHARLGGVVLAPGGLRVQERQNPDREGRRGEERGDDDVKVKRDSPARKRSISGSGDDAAKRLRLYLRVEGARGRL